MTLTTEVLLFPTSKECRKNPQLLFPALDVLLKANGSHGPAYYGIQIENPSTGYLFFNWDSFEKYEAFMAGPSYDTLMEKLEPCLGDGPLDIYHIKLTSSTIALEMPVTATLIVTLRAPEYRKEVEDILTDMSIGKKLAYGQVLEDPDRYILLGGWDTVEQHHEISQKPQVAATLDRLFSLASMDHINHSKLSQYLCKKNAVSRPGGRLL